MNRPGRAPANWPVLGVVCNKIVEPGARVQVWRPLGETASSPPLTFPPQFGRIKIVMKYFAYGSNLHLPHLRSWLARCRVDPDELGPAQHAILDDYRLRTNYLCSHGAGAANIEPAPRHKVEGIVMAITPAVRQALRLKEGYPHRYEEIEVAVMPCRYRRKVRAFTYLVAREFRLPHVVPVTEWYRRLILEGAASHGFSPAYQEYLRRTLRTLRNKHVLRPEFQ